MPDFRACLIEGAFYEDLRCGSGQNLQVELHALEGQRVRIAAHYLPVSPPDMSRPGAGSCLWPIGKCPAGHQTRPDWLFAMTGEGILSYKSKGLWVIEGLDGQEQQIPLGTLLPGHQARVAAASLLTIEEMRDTVTRAGLSDRVANLQDLLQRASRKTT